MKIQRLFDLVCFYPFLTCPYRKSGLFYFDECSFLFASAVFTVFTGCGAGILLKEITEVMGIIITNFCRDLRGPHIRRFQQFLCFPDPKSSQVLSKSQAGFLGKNSGKMALG